MAKQKKKYEIEVHAGLLVLIVIFLGLNFISNLIIYNTRNIKREQTTMSLHSAAMAINRNFRHDTSLDFNKDQINKINRTYDLSGLIVIPTQPPHLSYENRKEWFLSIFKKLPPGQIPDVVPKLLNTKYNTLLRGEDNEYFFVYPVRVENEKKLLVLSRNVSDLAYIETAAKNQLIISIIAVMASMFIYIFLYRFILEPFKILKKEAEDAGRKSNTGLDEVESVVSEYQKIINELREKEAELMILNKAIQRKADSLEHFNQYLLKSMSAGVITVNNEGNILSINKAVEEIFNINGIDYIESKYTELPFLPADFNTLVEQTLLDNKFHPYSECEIATEKSDKVTIGVTISPILDDKTSQIGASILMNNLTELRSLQQQLEQNSRMVALGEMAAGLAHQLRNSLGAIVGYNTLVKKKLKKSDFHLDAVDNIESELLEAGSLISKFLTFTKAFDYNPQRENLVEIIRDVIDMLTVRPDCFNVQYNFTHSLEKEVWGEVDQLLLKQALVNVLENCKYAYENNKGVVQVELSQADDKLVLSVKDFGKGIEKESINKIFTPFYSSSPSGTGLGLPLAQKIISLHNGSIQVTSQIGSGTTFKIILPVTIKTDTSIKQNH